jgi:hypothetical protein
MIYVGQLFIYKDNKGEEWPGIFLGVEECDDKKKLLSTDGNKFWYVPKHCIHMPMSGDKDSIIDQEIVRGEFCTNSFDLEENAISLERAKKMMPAINKYLKTVKRLIKNGKIFCR